MTHTSTKKGARGLHIHFVGIGGIGVSALARLLISFGAKISGSDLTKNTVTKVLQKMGVPISIGKHDASHLNASVDLLVYSPAVLKENPERRAAAIRHIEQLSYPEAVARFFGNHDLICVAGTHGKSSTTSLFGHVCVVAHKDPSIIVGTLMKNYGNQNTKKGNGKNLIIEADEYKESFLSYWPKGVICTRIEADHLDYYKNLAHITSAFKKLLLRVSKDGFVVINADDAASMTLKKKLRARIYTYGISSGMFRAQHIVYTPLQTTFSIVHAKETWQVATPLLGEHNVYNTLAVWAAARALNIPPKIITKGLTSFKGIWRRFDVVSKKYHTPIVDDYAHHPTEIKACIAALRQAYPKRKMHFVYQPHQEDRLFKLFKDFPPAFDAVDSVYFLPVYQVAGRRTRARKTSLDLTIACKKRGVDAVYTASDTACLALLAKRVKKGDLVAFVGAGDIIQIRSKFVTLLKRLYGKKR